MFSNWDSPISPRAPVLALHQPQAIDLTKATTKSVEGATKNSARLSPFPCGVGGHWDTLSCLLPWTVPLPLLLLYFPKATRPPTGALKGLFFSAHYKSDPKLPGRPAGKHSVKELFQGCKGTDIGFASGKTSVKEQSIKREPGLGSTGPP